MRASLYAIVDVDGEVFWDDIENSFAIAETVGELTDQLFYANGTHETGPYKIRALYVKEAFNASNGN